MKRKITLFLMFCSTTLVFAEYKKQNIKYDPETHYQQKAENEKYKKFYPTKERLELASKSWKIRSVIEDERRLQEELSETRLLKVSNTPKIKIMKNADTLDIHPQYPLLIMLPKYCIVTNAYCYPPTAKPIWQFNAIDVIPSKELLNSTLVITYLQNYEPKRFTIQLNKIKNSKHSLLYTEVRYVHNNILDVEEVLSKYYYVHNRYPTHNSMIRIGKNVYTFIKDNANGTLSIDGSDGKFLMKINRN